MSVHPITATSYPSARRSAPRAWRGAAATGCLAIIVGILWQSGRVTAATTQRVAETASVLSELRRAIDATGGFQPTVGVNPMTLSQLTRPIWNARVDAGDAPMNSCGKPFTDEQVQNWTRGGPFVPFYISTTGLRTPIGVIADTLQLTYTRPTAAVLGMQIRDVAERDARLLDRLVDGGDGAHAGTVEWVPKDGNELVLYSVGSVPAC